MSGCDVKHLIKTTKFLPDIFIDGEKLDKTELAQEIQYHPADSFQSALQQAAQALIIRRLLRREANAQGLTTENEEQAFAALVAKNSHYEPPSEADCLRYYEQHPKPFTTAPLMVVRHILLAADKNDLAWRAEQKNVADALLQRIAASSDVAAAFREAVCHSRCPSRDDGGLLGELSVGQTVPEFERQIFALNVGLAPQPIETRYGYHLVYIERKIAGQRIPYAEAKPRIIEWLTARRARQAAADYLYRLTQNARIEGLEMRLNEENIVLPR